MSRTKIIVTVGIALATVLGFTAAIAAPTGAAFTASDDATTNGFGGDFSFVPGQDGDEHPGCENGQGNQSNNNPHCEDEENGGGGEEPGDGVGTCEEGGAAQENTVANEAFGTENESGPISGPLHENEGQFQDAEPVAHEGSCVVATVDNNAPDDGGGDGGPQEQVEEVIGELENATNGSGNEDPQEQIEELIGELENASDGGDEDPQEQFEELIEELQNASDGGDEDPQEQIDELIGELENASDGGDEDPQEQIEGLLGELQNATDQGDGDEPSGDGTCTEGGAAQENTVANEAFGTENESGPISSEIHANEEQFQDGEPVAHEGSCVVATVDNNAPDDGGGGDEDPQDQVDEVVGDLEDTIGL